MAVASKKSAPSIAHVAPAPEVPIEKVVEAAPAAIDQMQENVRKAVEKSVADTRAAFAKVKTAADEATGALESSYSTASKGVVTFNTKTLDVLRANAEANFDFVKAVINARSVSEFVTLQSEHASKQIEAMNAQVKEIASLAQKIAADSVEPIKSQVAKTFRLSA